MFERARRRARVAGGPLRLRLDAAASSMCSPADHACESGSGRAGRGRVARQGLASAGMPPELRIDKFD
jgi:hypothetical protein